MLYLERHDLHLRTFPEGSFSHTIISPADAKKRIERALESDDFFGTFKHDNRNPKLADKRFDDFIKVMEQHCNIKLPVDRFFNKEVLEDGETLTFGNPAGLAVLKKGDALLVIGYCFGMAEMVKGETVMDRFRNMPISPDTIEFHLFEMIDKEA